MVIISLKIRPVDKGDKAEWLRMRMALWPDADPGEERAVIQQFLSTTPHVSIPSLDAAYVCERPGGGLCGLVEVSIRPYVDGCQTNGVGYLEAWYVDPDFRGRGIGRSLVGAAEDWARSQGCQEMASDTDLDNLDSQAAHHRLGYTETGRIVQFSKVL
jgi:aminoglycoside 6'-N-acetyltransferase I